MLDKTIYVPSSPLNTPVLFLVFNRLDTSMQVLESIREAKPPRIYLAADGPRDNVKGENSIVKNVVKSIVQNIDWDCEIHTLIREHNLGCKLAISEAISWFFENEDQGIILEDDCLPCKSFFWFCEEMLNTYKNDLRIWHISGDNFQHGIPRSEESYYFSKYVHVWGWATWKNRWQSYDVMMSSYKEFKKNNFVKSLSDNRKMRRHWMSVFDRAANQKVDTWDFQWTYAVKTNNGLSIIPENNLVSNIGFGENATHTKSNDSNFSSMNTLNLEWPLKHPLFKVHNHEADKYTTSQKTSIVIAIQNIINKLLGYLR